MKDLFLLPKSNFKWLLSFCLVALLSLPSNSLLAQPSAFTISGCSVSGADGNYTRNATDAFGCPCYDNSNGGVMYSNFGFWIYRSSGTCSSPSGGSSVYSDPGGCDISTATANACDPATALTLSPATSADVPTLSEWGLIILALMFMTMGTLYLVQPNFRRGFEQK